MYKLHNFYNKHKDNILTILFLTLFFIAFLTGSYFDNLTNKGL